MDTPFIAMIIIFAGNFQIRGWAFCAGQLLAINTNTALFSLVGTTYGGNGTTTFALPDLRGRVPIGFGQGPGLTNVNLGEVGGSEAVTLLTTQIPAHGHPAAASTAAGTSTTPTGNVWAASGSRDSQYAATANTTMSPAAVGQAGGGQPHENRQPYLGLNYLIALQGIFPSRD